MKQKVLAGNVPGNVEDQSELERRGAISRQLALTVIWALIGLLVPRAHVYGSMAPFGVAVAASASGPGALLVYALTSIGYLLPADTVFPLRYIAAVAAVAGIKWTLSGIKGLTKHVAFAPVISFIAACATGVAINVSLGTSVAGIIIVVCESMIAAGFSYFISIVMRLCDEGHAPHSLTASEQASLAVVASVLIMAMADIQISGISPGRVVAVLLVLVFARCGREQGGCIAGVVLGMAMALTGADNAYLAAAYSFGGLLAGIFSRFGRFATAGCFILANTIISMSHGDATVAIINIYEVAAAGLLYVLMPPVLDRKINGLFLRTRDMYAVEGLRRSVTMRLDFASKAMTEVSGTVDTVSRKLAGLSAPDLGTVYRDISDEVCRVCGLRMFCWEHHFSDTMSSLNDLTPTLREKGQVDRSDLTGHLARHCSRPDEVVRRVNAGYMEYVVREGAWRRLTEIRSVVADQFSSMSDMLAELAEEFSSTERVDTDAAQRVYAVCEQYGFLVHDVSCLIGRGGHMSVEILASDVNIKLNESKWHTEVGTACGCIFDHPTVTRAGDSVRITLLERTNFKVEIGMAQLCCTGEKLCGDAYETFQDATGRLFVVLSDGMGSGGRAAVDGAMAAGLTSRLIQAGFGADSVLRMVNSALMVKSGDESLATLDIAAIDLFTGRVESLKAGACSSLLRSMGRVSRTERSSLPMGILREVSFERSTDTLVNDDVMLIISDGVISNGTGWVEEALRDYSLQNSTVTELAQFIATEARKKQQGDHEDDTTVIALHVIKRS